MGARHPRSGPHLAPAENGAAKSPPVTPTSAAAGCHCACALHPAHPAPSAENTDPGPWSCDGRGASGLRLYRRMVVSLAALSPLPRCSYPAKAQRAAKLGALRVGSRGVSAGAEGPVCRSPSFLSILFPITRVRLSFSSCSGESAGRKDTKSRNAAPIPRLQGWTVQRAERYAAALRTCRGTVPRCTIPTATSGLPCIRALVNCFQTASRYQYCSERGKI